uniref:C2H2-type domain-containing protein n=1 Tax=Periophthalmus magnuspinnatus TaxID=409849 RepID=A0A3B4AIQ6_9GOBI
MLAFPLHKTRTLQKNTYSCPDCGKRFSRAKALQFHMKSHGYESGYSPPSHRSGDPVEDLQCPSCFALFNKKSSLRAHRKLCTKKEKSTQPTDKDSVGVIHTESKSIDLKENHLENDKTDELKYKCKVCERSFSVVGALNFHKRIHTESHKALAKAKALVKKSKVDDSNKGVFSCADCGRRFVSNSALGSHKRWHRDKPSQRHASRHLEESQEADEGSGSDESCKLCDKLYFYLHAYKKHKKMHKLESEQMNSPYNCPKCGCAFSTQEDLINHRKLNKTCSSNLRCDPCNKSFASVASWSGHLKLHEERTFWCFTCAKGFTDQSIYKNHMYLHKCRRYSCTVCNKRFLFLRHLSDHYNLHTGAKPHICTYCGKAFSHSATLYAHKKTHHMISLFKSRLKSGWTSKQKNCRLNNDQRRQLQTTLQTLSEAEGADLAPQSGTFSKLSELSIHKKIHFGQHGYTCTQCGKPCKTLTLLKYHCRTHTGERPYVCKECGKRFTMPKALQKHMESHLPEGAQPKKQGKTFLKSFELYNNNIDSLKKI